MKNINIEIKAYCRNCDHIRKILHQHKADFKGIDEQTDTYFKCHNGRLKLREGKIEYSLVFYDREDISGPKRSDVIYYHPVKKSPLKDILTASLGKLVTVVKSREIYYIDNIKFHLDEVEGLGDFVEIEAIDNDGSLDKAALLEQCNRFLDLFEIEEKDLIECSYSDMLLDKVDSKR